MEGIVFFNNKSTYLIFIKCLLRPRVPTTERALALLYAAYATTHPSPPTNSSKTDPQMRHRVVEAPIGKKVGYHELGDEAEDADVEWMTGEASNISGGGVRGSRNWLLTILLPIFVSFGSCLFALNPYELIR